jgi:ATP-dependent DNA helicase RecG
MTPEQLRHQLDSLIAGWEDECVEFKDANDNFSTSDIGRYFSALANEANLRDRDAGWLVFGVDNKTRQVIGTRYREDRERLHSLKRQIADGTDPSTTLRDIHELTTPQGRVLLFEVPPAPRGIPIGWNAHYYARDGESLGGLSISKQDAIRAQGANADWSAVVCAGATVSDLHPDALAKAREVFAARHQGRIPAETLRGWSDEEFLANAKLSINGGIPRGTLLLLGKTQSTHYLSPCVAEITWKLEGEETAYEHFHPPFLLETSRLYQRIRNLPLTLLPPNQLIPIEIRKYDERMVLEALHNCIAHQDYSRCERIVVIERATGLEFQNGGDFYDGKPLDYVLQHRTPKRYRNRFLAEAMANLRMMDTMGFGIRTVLFQGQRSRYMPLPDYSFSQPGEVVMRLAGRFMDENYSRVLLTNTSLGWPEVLALDAIQKGQTPDKDVLPGLRRQHLVEGRKGRLHVASEVALATDTVEEYLHHRAFDDRYFCDLIVDYLKTKGEGRRADFARLLGGKLSDLLTEKQKETKIKYLLQKLRRSGVLVSDGNTKAAIWRLAMHEPGLDTIG